MTTVLAPLCTLEITHEYYGGRCRDFEFVLEADAIRWARRSRLLLKPVDGGLHVFFEANEAGQPVVRSTGSTLRIGLRVVNPLLSNVTANAFAAGTIAVYRNATNPSALDVSVSAAPVGGVFAHPLRRADRPVAVRVEAGTRVLAEQTVPDGDDRLAVSFDLAGAAPGLGSIVERYPGNVVETTPIYFGGELVLPSLFGLVEIVIADVFYTTPATFQIALASRQETLKYYVVARDYTAAEIGQLTVADAGFAEDVRPQIAFTRVAAGGFTSGEIPAAAFGNTGATVVLFKSQAPVARRARGRRRIQLRRDGDVLVANLPQPGPERTTADLIVHLSKKS